MCFACTMSAAPGFQSEDAGGALAGVGVFMQQDVNDSRFIRNTETCILLPIARFLTQLQSFREDGGSLWSGRTRWPRASPSFVSFFYVRLIDCSLMLFQVGDVIISVDGESVVGMVSPLPYCPSLVIQMF
jgi:hypothetical protein